MSTDFLLAAGALEKNQVDEWRRWGVQTDDPPVAATLEESRSILEALPEGVLPATLSLDDLEATKTQSTSIELVVEGRAPIVVRVWKSSVGFIAEHPSKSGIGYILDVLMQNYAYIKFEGKEYELLDAEEVYLNKKPTFLMLSVGEKE